MGTVKQAPKRAARAGWYVYIVRCADRTLYTGVAKDLPRRIAAHNDGRGAKYTRQRLPVKLVYSESAADRGAALRREWQIKQLKRAAKRALFASLRASSLRTRTSGRRAGRSPSRNRRSRRLCAERRPP